MPHVRRSGLEMLSSEIITLVGTWLDMYDVQSLRLVNHALARHSFDAFRQYIRRRTIYLDAQVLEDIKKQLNTDGLACYMEEARFSDGSTWFSDLELYNSLEAFLLLVKHRGRLQSVDIATTTGSHRTILLALTTVSIPLRTLKLHVYGDDGPAGLTDYHDLLDKEHSRLIPLFEQLKEFSWHFDWYPVTVEGVSKSNQVDSVTAISGFVGLIPRMEKLSLHWFSRTPFGGVLRESEPFFDSMFEAILTLPRLHDFYLYGYGLSENMLLRFLKTTIAKTISLHALRLRTGTWQSILAVLTSGRFETIRIGDLHEVVNHEYKPIFFNTMRGSNRGNGHSRTDKISDREEEDTLMPLQYSTTYWLQSGARGVTISWHKGIARSTWI